MKHIVIFEDDKTSARYLKVCIKYAPYDYDSIIFYNGYSGLSHVKEHSNNILLIFMDIDLPGINGLDAVKIIKKEHPTIPIIVLTACCYDRRTVLLSGCDQFIIKPIPVKKVSQLIKYYSEATP